MNNFIVLGNGSTGTTFLYEVFNDHPEIEMIFEPFENSFDDSLEFYLDKAKEVNLHGKVFGFKLPFEQVIMRFNDRWKIEDFTTLSKHFKVFGTYRRFNSWMDSWNRHQEPALTREEAFRRWQQGQMIMDGLANRRRVLSVVNYHEYMVNFAHLTAFYYNLIGVDATFVPEIKPDTSKQWVNEVSINAR